MLPPAPIEGFVADVIAKKRDLCEEAAAALERANHNESGNTYLARDAARTLEQAEQQERRCAGQQSPPPLLGVPVSLKDCFDLQGFITSSGSRYYASHRAPAAADSAVAAMLKRAGAVITGKTHMQQLAYGITGENRDYGDCLQPADATALTGGSSSGGAASVQEGSALAAIGTDTGGSIRVPAALCGLAGYRASLGLADWQGAGHLAPSFDTIGWLFRDLRDAPRLAAALGFPGPALDDPVGQARALPELSIGCVAGELIEDCDAVVLQSLAEWKDRLERSGATVDEVDGSSWIGAYDIFAPIQAHEAAQLHRGLYENFEPAIVDRLRWGASLSAEEVERWCLKCREFIVTTTVLFGGRDFLLMPASPVTKLEARADHSAARPRILRHTTPASVAGLPVVVLPAYGAGMQLMGRRNQDAKLLAFAARIGRLLLVARSSPGSPDIAPACCRAFHRWSPSDSGPGIWPERRERSCRRAALRSPA